jgi:membrane-bound lytic murein transglycosylase D
MRRLLFFGFGVICWTIPLEKALSQEESPEGAIGSSENILPSYRYDFIPDFTYEQVAERINAMETGMPFELNDRIFSFIQYYTVRNRDYTKMVLARREKYFPLF